MPPLGPGETGSADPTVDAWGAPDLRGEADRRARFARVFAKEDPWGFLASGYESLRHQLTLELVPPCGLALEVGCAEGVFTRLLADRAVAVVAFDIDSTALARARRRCRDRANISFVQADLVSAWFLATFDVVVATEVLGYLEQCRHPQVVQKIARWLTPYGRLICNPPEDDLEAWLSLLARTGLVVKETQHVQKDGQECWLLAAQPEASRADRAETRTGERGQPSPLSAPRPAVTAPGVRAHAGARSTSPARAFGSQEEHRGRR